MHMGTVSNNYLIYLRKSRADIEAEMRGEGETLARHEQTLIELAGRKGLNVTDIYREIVSGETIAARPMMQRLLTEVEDGCWTGVLVMEVERLARGDTIDQGIVSQAFKYSGTVIVTPSKTYDPNNEFDEEYFEFGLFMSRREYQTIRRRLRRGRYASVREGKYIGSIPPFGYDRVKLEREKGYTLAPNPTEAPVVKMIFEWYTTGEKKDEGAPERLGSSRIARRLNDMGVRTKHGNTWFATSVREILINPVYLGMTFWKRRPTEKRLEYGKISKKRTRDLSEFELFQGLHPPLVDKETFDLANEYLKESVHFSMPEAYELQNPFAGILICGKCGRAMQRKKNYSRKGTAGMVCTNPVCDNIGVGYAILETHLLNALRAWLSEYKLSWEQEAKAPPASLDVMRNGIKRLKTECAELRKQRDRLHDLLERGIYDTDTFLERSRNIAERLRQAESDLDMMQTELGRNEKAEAERGEIIPKVERLLDVYDSLPTPAAKNALLREAVEKVVYTKEVRYKRRGEDVFTLDIYPRLPKLSE
jgi:DNA invertase Pin-like site-specific DNA recombinase